jgi:hypothetical protein
MNKTKTVVTMLLVTLGGLCQGAFADPAPATNTPAVDAATLLSGLGGGGCESGYNQDIRQLMKDKNALTDAKQITKIEAQIKDLEAKIRTNCPRNTTSDDQAIADGDCTQAEDAYKRIKSKFVAICGATHMPRDTQEGGIGCAMAVAKCDCQYSDLSKDQHDALDCKTYNAPKYDYTSASGMKVMREQPYDIAKASVDLKNCPVIDSTVREDVAKQLDASKKSAEAYEKNLPTLKAAAQNARQDMEKAMQGIDEEKTSKKQAHEEEIAKIKKDQTDNSNRITERYFQMQNQLDQAQAQFDNVRSQIQENDINYKAELNAVDMKCYGIASNQIRDLQQRVIAKMATGTYMRGDQNELAKSIGITSRTQWIRLQKHYYDTCRKSDLSILKEKELLLSKYKVNSDKVHAAEPFLRKSVQNLQQQMDSLKNGKGCMGFNVSAESTECQNARQAQTALSNEVQSYNDSMRDLAKRKSRAMTSGLEAIKLAQENLTKQQDQYNSEIARRDNYEAYFNMLTQQKVLKGGTDPNAPFNQLNAQFGMMTSAAEFLVTCKKNGDINEDKSCSANSMSGNSVSGCYEADRFLNSLGRPVNVSVQGPENPAPAAPAAAAADPAAPTPEASTTNRAPATPAPAAR